ncbi:MAG: nitroreductase family protein [Hyphomicrobiaceae bacterium]
MSMVSQKIEGQTKSLALRYGETAIPVKGPWNDVIGGLLAHRSVRGFKADAPPPGTLETLIAAAQSAATSSNLQTWSVVSVTKPEVRAEFARIANNQKHIEQCPIFLCFLADVSRLDRLGKEEGIALENTVYLETFLVAAIDAALAAQNAVVAAESLGLANVYIGAMRNDIERVAQLLNLPPNTMCVFGLCIGYAADGVTNAVKARLPQAAVLHHEVYDASREQAIRKTYDEELARYSKHHEMAQYTWTERVLSRVAKIKAMSGRDRMKAAVERLGFPLR